MNAVWKYLSGNYFRDKWFMACAAGELTLLTVHLVIGGMLFSKNLLAFLGVLILIFPQALFFSFWITQQKWMNLFYLAGTFLFLLLCGGIFFQFIKRLDIWPWFTNPAYAPTFETSLTRIGDVTIPYWGIAFLLYAFFLRLVGFLWCVFRGRKSQPLGKSNIPAALLATFPILAFAAASFEMGVVLNSAIGILAFLFIGMFYGIEIYF